MRDEQRIDDHLAAVFTELVDAIQETKQGVLTAATPEQRQALDALRLYLIEQAAIVSDAELSIAGRSPSIVSPTGHQPRNLWSEAGGDSARLIELLLEGVAAVSADARRRAGELDGTEEAVVLRRLAQGIDQRASRLQVVG